MNRGFSDFLAIGSDIIDGFGDQNLRKWDEIAKSIPVLLERGEFRGKINNLPDINMAEFSNQSGVVKRIYTMITFIAHAYIKGNQDDSEAEV